MNVVRGLPLVLPKKGLRCEWEGCVKLPWRVMENYEGHCSAHGSLLMQLVLRNWRDINPALEFRCFVKESVLIGRILAGRDHLPLWQDCGADPILYFPRNQPA